MLLVQHVLDGNGLAGDGGDHLGDAVHVGERNVLGPAHVADGGPRLHAPKGDDLRHLIAPVLVDGVADHLFALIVGIVQVKIGHGDAARIEKALEDQVVLERIQPGDAGAVGHERACARTAHVPPDVAAAGKVTEIRHDQEVDVKTHLVDDAQFALFALLHFGIFAASP